jgi:drug/metabolite transporter (DMT)-like permease
MYKANSGHKVVGQAVVGQVGLCGRQNESMTSGCMISMNSNRNLGVATTLIAIILLAGNGYFAKGLIADTYALTLIRSVIAAITIYLFVKIKGQNIKLDSRRDYVICSCSGLLLGIHWLCFFYSMHISTVALGMTTLYTYPIMTLWLESFFLKKKVHARDGVNTLVVVVGIVLIGLPEAVGFNGKQWLNSEASANNLLGLGLGLISALCFAVRNIIQQQFLSSYAAHKTIFYQVMVISCLMSIFFGVDIYQSMSLDLVKQEGFQWLLLGVLFTALPHSLIATGIKNIGAKSVSIIGCLQPVIGALLAYLILDELSSNLVVIGCVVVMTGAVLEIYYQGKLNQRK